MRVDPERLRAVAERMRTASRTAAAAYASRSSRLAPAEGAGAGWSAGAASRSACSAWAVFVGRLANSLDETGERLAATVASYQAADEHAADRQPLPGPR